MYEYPYYNQQYGQPNMQMQNQRIPYMQNQNVMQPQVQQYPMNQQNSGQPQGIIGKIVNDFSELTANDVPMNGSTAFFPKADGMEIQARSWTPNGTIQTVSYRPILEQNQSEGTNIPQTDFNALNEDVRALRQEISERFDRLESSMTNSKTKSASSRTKKEMAADE